jgi:hypothetical protein
VQLAEQSQFFVPGSKDGFVAADRPGAADRALYPLAALFEAA